MWNVRDENSQFNTLRCLVKFSETHQNLRSCVTRPWRPRTKRRGPTIEVALIWRPHACPTFQSCMEWCQAPGQRCECSCCWPPNSNCHNRNSPRSLNLRINQKHCRRTIHFRDRAWNHVATSWTTSGYRKWNSRNFDSGESARKIVWRGRMVLEVRWRFHSPITVSWTRAWFPFPARDGTRLPLSQR